MLSSQFPIPTQMNTIFSVQSKTNSREAINPCPIRFRLAGASSKCGAVGIHKERNSVELGEGLDPEIIPKHIAIIMDGNRRWAKEKGLPVQHGHRAGGKAMKQLALNCMKHGARVLSLFSFSTENWVRSEEEVDSLMSLLEEITASDVPELVAKDDMRVTFLGDRRRLPLALQSLMRSAEEKSRGNKGMNLVFALNYSGRYDITEATKRIATKVKDGILHVDDIDDAVFEQHLDTFAIGDFPNPDLLIRTSGELRISNYMLWQLAYAELFFTNKLFPDFGEDDVVEAITAFQQRQRRYGGV